MWFVLWENVLHYCIYLLFNYIICVFPMKKFLLLKLSKIFSPRIPPLQARGFMSWTLWENRPGMKLLLLLFFYGSFVLISMECCSTVHVYNKAFRSYIYICQLIDNRLDRMGWHFLRKRMGTRWVLKNRNLSFFKILFCLNSFFLIPQSTPGTLASTNNKLIQWQYIKIIN